MNRSKEKRDREIERPRERVNGYKKETERQRYGTGRGRRPRETQAPSDRGEKGLVLGPAAIRRRFKASSEYASPLRSTPRARDWESTQPWKRW